MSDMMKNLRAFVVVLKDHPWILVSLTAFLVWPSNMFYGDVAPSYMVYSDLLRSGFSGWFISLAFSAISILLIILFSRSVSRFSSSRPVLMFLAAAASISILCIVAGGGSPVLLGIAYATNGLVIGAMCAVWGFALPRYSDKQTLSLVATAALLCGLINLILVVLPSWVSSGIDVVAPFVMCASYVLEEEMTSKRGARDFVRTHLPKGFSDKVLQVTAFIATIAIGAAYGLVGGFSPESVTSSSLVYFSWAMLLVGLLLVMVLEFSNGRIVYVLAAIVLLMGVIVASLVVSDTPESVIGVHMIGHACFFIFLWIFCSWYARERRNQLGSFLVLFLFFFLAQIAGKLAAPLFSWTGNQLSLIAALMSAFFLLFFASVMLARTSSMDIQAYEQYRSLRDVCADLGVQKGLTEREREILELLIDNGSKGGIARELGVSEETIKTHVKHIYTKLGVHSKQEIVEMLSAMRAEYIG